MEWITIVALLTLLAIAKPALRKISEMRFRAQAVPVLVTDNTSDEVTPVKNIWDEITAVGLTPSNKRKTRSSF